MLDSLRNRGDRLEEGIRDRDDCMLAVFCWGDEAIPAVLETKRPRQRGPCPVWADSAGLTRGVVGESLGLVQDRALFACFRRHAAPCFPALRALQRIPFVRQVATRWWLKERLWQYLLDLVAHDPTLAVLDSLPLPGCPCARA